MMLSNKVLECKFPMIVITGPQGLVRAPYRTVQSQEQPTVAQGLLLRVVVIFFLVSLDAWQGSGGAFGACQSLIRDSFLLLLCLAVEAHEGTA